MTNCAGPWHCSAKMLRWQVSCDDSVFLCLVKENSESPQHIPGPVIPIYKLMRRGDACVAPTASLRAGLFVCVKMNHRILVGPHIPVHLQRFQKGDQAFVLLPWSDRLRFGRVAQRHRPGFCFEVDLGIDVGCIETDVAEPHRLVRPALRPRGERPCRRPPRRRRERRALQQAPAPEGRLRRAHRHHERSALEALLQMLRATFLVVRRGSGARRRIGSV